MARIRRGATAEYAEHVRAAWKRAADRRGTTALTIDIAGRAAELRFAGSALLERQRGAVAHLVRARAAGPVSFQLHIFHGESSDAPVAEPPCRAPGALSPAARAMGRLTDGRYEVLHEPASGLVSLFDAPFATGFFYAPSLAAVPVFERAAPWRVLLHRWLRQQGLVVAHAAAVAAPGGAVLLPGPSGTGKSTLALAAAARGFALIGDDTVVLAPGAPSRVYRLYGWVKVAPQTLALVPELAALPVRATAEDGKRVLEGASLAPAVVADGAPVRALVVPDRAAARPGRISPAEALRALAPSTLVQLRGADRSDLDRLAVIVAGIAGYRLPVGDLSRAVAELGEILSATGSAS